MDSKILLSLARILLKIKRQRVEHGTTPAVSSRRQCEHVRCTLTKMAAFETYELDAESELRIEIPTTAELTVSYRIYIVWFVCMG